MSFLNCFSSSSFLFLLFKSSSGLASCGLSPGHWRRLLALARRKATQGARALRGVKFILFDEHKTLTIVAQLERATATTMIAIKTLAIQEGNKRFGPKFRPEPESERASELEKKQKDSKRCRRQVAISNSLLPNNADRLVSMSE